MKGLALVFTQASPVGYLTAPFGRRALALEFEFDHEHVVSGLGSVPCRLGCGHVRLGAHPGDGEPHVEGDRRLGPLIVLVRHLHLATRHLARISRSRRILAVDRFELSMRPLPAGLCRCSPGRLSSACH